MEVRGHCLIDNRRFADARQAYERAYNVAPDFVRLENHLRKVDERNPQDPLAKIPPEQRFGGLTVLQTADLRHL